MTANEAYAERKMKLREPVVTPGSLAWLIARVWVGHPGVEVADQRAATAATVMVRKRSKGNTVDRHLSPDGIRG